MNNRILQCAKTSPLTMASLDNHMLQGDAFRMKQFFKRASCHPTTVWTHFEDFSHVNADAAYETKIVTTKFALSGFCHNCDFVC